MYRKNEDVRKKYLETKAIQFRIPTLQPLINLISIFTGKVMWWLDRLLRSRETWFHSFVKSCQRL